MQYFEVMPIFARYLGNIKSFGDGSPKFCSDERISIEVVHGDIVM